MKKFSFILFFLLKIISVEAQGLDADSLRNLLTAAKGDTTKVLLMSQLGIQLDRSNPDSGLQLAQQGLALAQKINYKKGELYCKLSMAIGFWSLGDYSTTIKISLSILNDIEQSNDLHLQITFYANLSSTYRDQGDYAEALKYNFKTLNLIVEDSCRACRAAYTGPASVFIETHQLDSAKIYMQKAFLYPPVKGTDGWIYTTAGRVQTELKNYDSALHLYHQSIEAHKQINNLKDLANSYNYIATLFKTTGQKDSALFYLRQSLNISQPKKFAREAFNSFLLLSEIYEPSNTDSALHYYKQATIAQDSLFNQEKQRQILSYKFNEELQQQQLEKTRADYKSKIKIYLLIGVLIVFIVIGIILWRSNQHKKKAYALLQQQKQETDIQKAKVEQTLTELKSTQSQLIQSEKMASLGELTAGIAHEIQNPLNFVNNFSEVNKEMIDELQTELKSGNTEEAIAISNDIKDNEEKINHHGKRADAIVKGMLQHSRASTGKKEPTDINALCDEYLRLSYHGLRAKDKNFNADFKTDFDENINKINIVPQDIGRVLLNLFNNAFYATSEKQKAESLKQSAEYKPTVSIQTKKINDKVEIKVIDNGNGIPQNIIDKIFQPFFTTKPTGQGTGLGLSLSYDIIKAHGGEIKVETNEGEGSEFIILLPFA